MTTNSSEDIELLRESVRRFAQEKIAPIAQSVDQDNEFPADMWRQLGNLGLLGVTIPEKFGGTGLGYLAHLIAVEEISRASASIGLSYGAHSNLCLNNLYLNGSEEQRRGLLRGG